LNHAISRSNYVAWTLTTGEFEYKGILVSDWLEFSDETKLRQLLSLLLEVARDPDEWEMDFEEDTGVELKVADYRRNTQFTPELVFEFVGDTTIQMEINLTTERVLIQASERWEVYNLDPWSAAALKAMVMEERGGPVTKPEPRP
jgi:hypothetical protein